MINYKIICVPISLNVSSHCSTEQDITNEHQYAATIVETQDATNATPPKALGNKCRKRPSDAYDVLVEAETAKVHLEQEKLQLECSVLAQKIEVGQLKIELIKRKIQLLDSQ